MPNRFLLTLEVSATYGSAAPTLEVLVGGVVVSSSTVLAHTGIGTNIFEYSLDFTGNSPASLSFRFNDGSPEGGRNISFAHVYANGQEINAAYLSQLLVTNGQSNSVTVASVAYLFGRTEPVTADLGVATITGTAGVNTINGTTGNDIINGLAGNDRIDGKAGDDKITGGANDDTLYGGTGNDLVMGDTGNDRIFGNDGNDLLYGNDGNDIMDGGAGNDVLSGGNQNDTMLGGAGNDILYGGAGVDTLSGDLGDDYLFGDDGIDLMAGGVGNDVMYGGNGNDSMDGAAGNDTLYGEANDDMMNGAAGDDIMDGGSGNDQLNGGTGNDNMAGGAGDDIIQGDVGNDTLNGDADNDVLSGGSGNDTITGGDGDDRLYGHALTSTAASAILSANAGVVYDATSNSFYKLITGTATLAAAQAAAAATTLSGVAGHLVTITSAAENARVLSIAAGNTVWLGGSDAADEGVWTWGAGYENGLQFWSGAAAGAVVNGFYTNWAAGQPDDAGNADGMTMGAGGTWSDQTVGSTFAYIIEWDAIAFSDDSGIDNLSGGNGNDILWGGAGADILAGDANDDKIYGGAGNDTITGGDGNDILTGNAGTDNINGGNGTDMVNYITAGGAVTLSLLAGSATSDGDSASDTLSFIENVNGSSFNDSITGDGSANVIYGNAGNDTITGGAGADSLYGGAGNDTFNLANNDFAAGEIIDGGTAVTVDTITLTNATTIDFTTGTLSGVETLNGSASNDTVTLTLSMLTGMFTTVDMAGGAGDVMNTSFSGSVTVSSMATISNLETGNLTGSGGVDALTLSGAQLDSLLGSSSGTFNIGGGADTLTLTSTSARLNAAGLIDASVQGLETITVSGSPTITINMSGQTEAFAITGGGGDDTILGGSAGDTIAAGNGNNTITGGAGVDTITAGTGTDTINLANGDFGTAESIDGGTGSDTIVLTNATTVDFTTGTLAGIDVLTGSGSNDAVTVSITHTLTTAGGGMFTTINLGGGTDALNARVSGTVNISAATLLALTGVEGRSLLGSGGDDVLTLTGAQMNALVTGTGIVDFGAGTGDTLNLNGTSTTLNTLGSTDDTFISGLEAISFAAGSAITVDLSLQAENLTLTGTAAGDTITMGDGDDTIIAGAGTDTIVAGEGDNTIQLANGDFSGAESITGGAGEDTLVLTTSGTTVDFTTGTLVDIDTLTGSAGGDTATLLVSDVAGQFTEIDLAGGADVLNAKVSGAVDISAATVSVISNVETSNLTGTGGSDTVTLTGAQLDAILIGAGTINLGAGAADTINITSTSADLNTLGATDASIQGLETVSASTAAAGVTITLGSQTEAFTITGSGFNDTLTGGSGADIITGGAGVDTINAGAGANTINLANGDFAAGESITGGAATDTVVLTNATTIDFATGTLSSIDTLTGSGSADTVTMAATLFGGMFTTINLGGGTDTLNVTTSGTVNISAASATTVSNTENGNLTGSTGDDIFTLTGAQLDGILGSTTGTIAMGSGTDTIVLTATSARFNTTAATDGSITGLEVITVSGSPAITINIAGQTEAFTINGGGGIDTVTGGKGDNTINGNAGNDVIVSSSIDTLTAQATAIVAANAGVVYNATTDSFYKLVSSLVTWTAASTAAAATLINGVAGHLVQINNAAENTYIDGLPGGANTVWLGVNDVTTNDTYLMMGGPMNGIIMRTGGAAANGIYANWAASNPGNSAADDDYVRQENGGTWTDQVAATTSYYVIEWEASQLTFATTSTTIIGGAGADTITGGAGKDTFVFDAASSGSIDTINGFSVAQHDVLDVSSLLTGYAPGTSDPDSFVRLTVSGGDLLLQVDANGTTGGSSYTTIATLVGLAASGLNVEEMVANDRLVLSVPTISFYFDWGTGNYTYNSNTISNNTFTNTTIGRAPMNGTNEFSIDRTSSTATLNYLNAGAPGTLIVTGSAESDRIVISGIITTVAGTVNLGVGNDTLVITSAGNFTIDGGTGNDTVTAGAGGDTITGGTGTDVLDGGSGNDTFNVASGDWSAGDSITGGANTDTLVLTNAQTTDFSTGTLATLETFTGSGGNDTATMTLLQFAQFSTFNMGAGTNVLNVTFGGTVDSTGLIGSPTVSNVGTGSFTGSANIDIVTITGGQLDGIINGTGTIDFLGSADILNLTSTSADLNTLGGTDARIANLETISAAGAASGVTITLTAQTEGFTVTGSANGDTITGGSGADTIEGLNGNDTLNGNGGTDTVTYTSAGSAVTVSLALQGSSQNTVGAGNDTLSNFENLTGSNFNDTLTGDGNVNTISGGTGNDTIYGGGNNDILNGGGGNDVMNGEAGNDTINSGSTDTLATLAAAIVAANSGVTYNATTGSFYKYVNSSVLWSTANTAAAGTLINGVAGHIVQINNSTENSYIDTLTTTRTAWLGLSDSGAEDNWVFMGGVMNGISVWSGNGVDVGGSAQNGIYNNWRTSSSPDQPDGSSASTTDYTRMRNGGTWTDESDTATARYVIEWEASQLLTPGNTTTLNGGLGNDTLNGSAGQDIFYFDVNSWGAANADTVNNYDRTDLDKLDIGDLLTGYTAGVSDDDLFARFLDTGNNLALQVDRDGAGGAYAFTTVATLVGQGATTALVQQYNVEEFVANGLLVMT